MPSSRDLHRDRRLSHDDKISKTDAEWREQLTPEEYAVLRKAGTERPWSGEYVETKTEGVYRCKACNAELFRSEREVRLALRLAVLLGAGRAATTSPCIEDSTLGMTRIEVRCANCDSHLGHVFHGEGYDTPTDARYCINCISLTLEPAQETRSDPAGQPAHGSDDTSSSTLRRRPV